MAARTMTSLALPSPLMAVRDHHRPHRPAALASRRRPCAPRPWGGVVNPTSPGRGGASTAVARSRMPCPGSPAHPDVSSARSAPAVGPAIAAALALALNAGPAVAAPAEMYTLADLDPGVAGALIGIITPVLSITQLFFIFRIILTWYPENEDKMPWLIIVKPTEPLLGPTRKVIKPIGGVDVSPVVWFAIFSFINEILIGPQGILRLLSQMRS